MAGRKAGTAVEQAKGTALATRQAPPLEIDPEDVALPSIKKGEYMSEQVKSRLVNFRDIYSSTSRDDGDPVVLVDAEDDEGLLFHVLGMRKGRSATVDGELQTYAYDDPDAPEDSWVTYQYFVVIPEHDTELPYKLLLTKTNRPAAQALNLALKRHRGDAWELAFRLSTKPAKNQKGEYCIFQVRSAQPETAAQKKKHEENVALCEGLVGLIAASTDAAGPASSGDTPDI